MTKVLSVDLSENTSLVRDMTPEEVLQLSLIKIAEDAIDLAQKENEGENQSDRKLLKAFKKTIKPFAQRVKKGEVLVVNDIVAIFNGFLTEYNK